jgi:hypothetical protein
MGQVEEVEDGRQLRAVLPPPRHLHLQPRRRRDPRQEVPHLQAREIQLRSVDRKGTVAAASDILTPPQVDTLTLCHNLKRQNLKARNLAYILST